jgi:hypothetical protein
MDLAADVLRGWGGDTMFSVSAKDGTGIMNRLLEAVLLRQDMTAGQPSAQVAVW